MTCFLICAAGFIKIPDVTMPDVIELNFQRCARDDFSIDEYIIRCNAISYALDTSLLQRHKNTMPPHHWPMYLFSRLAFDREEYKCTIK